MDRKAGLGRLGKRRSIYQYNYIDVVQNLVPNLYEDTDSYLHGQEEDILYSVLGKILFAAQGIKSIFDVTSCNVSSLQQHFIPSNDLTNIRPYFFERKILAAFSKNLSQFRNIEDWGNFVSGTLLPNIKLNSPTTSFASGVSANINSQVSTTEIAHQYLIDNLSWVYFLNTDGPAGGFDPSNVSRDLLVSSTFLGRSIQERDGIKGIFEYIWKNRELDATTAASAVGLIPPSFNKTDATVSSNIYASGNQLLSGLNTLVDVWYNPHDDASTKIETELQTLLSLSGYDSKRITGGPFQKFLKAISFGAHDLDSIVDDIGSLVDIERCDEQFLQYLAALIGWKTLTGDVDRWRGQLRQAVYIYKSKGTRKALRTACDLMFPEAGFDANKATKETWQSYFPYLIYYLIATESRILKDPLYNPTLGDVSRMVSRQTGPAGSTSPLNCIREIGSEGAPGIPLYDADDRDNNYRFATDYVISSVNKALGCVNINGTVYDANTWNPPDGGTNEQGAFPGFEHRGAFVPVPPWENERFYETTFVSEAVLSHVSSILIGPRTEGGLEVSSVYVQGMVKHVLDNNIQSSLMNGLNTKWKFYTLSAQQPPNFSSVISEGRAQDMSLKDYWSSKGSALITELDASSLTQNLGAGVSGTYGYKVPVNEIVYALTQLFRQFIPFHAITKFIVKDEFSDQKLVTGSGTDQGLVYAVAMRDPYDSDTFIFQDFKSAGYVASALSGTDAPRFVRRTYTATPRTSKRRRNLKYILPPGPYDRGGNAMPIATGLEGSGDVSSFSSINNYMNVSSFIPLGYNFSTGSFYNYKGASGGVYDASNDLGLTGLTTYYERNSRRPNFQPGGPQGGMRDTSATYGSPPIPVSSTFPCRVLGQVSALGSMGPINRSQMDFSTCAVYSTVMRNQRSGNMSLSLNPSNIDNVRFGEMFWGAYLEHQRYFDGVNFNYVYDAPTVFGVDERFAKGGGKSMGAQINGPVFFNSELAIPGHLTNGFYADASAFVGDPRAVSGLDTMQWSSIAATPKAMGETYFNSNSDLITVGIPSFLTGSRVVFPDPDDSAGNRQAMNTMVSGVTINGPTPNNDTSKSWAVYNHRIPSEGGSTNTTNQYGKRAGTVSLFSLGTGYPSVDKKDTLRLRYSLNQGQNFLSNPEFKYRARAGKPYSDIASTSGLAGWALMSNNTGDQWANGNWGITGGPRNASAGFFLSGIDPVFDPFYVSAVVSGNSEWKSGRSAHIFKTWNKSQGGDIHLGGLNPGGRYKLKIEAMTRDADASGLRVYVVRKAPNPDNGFDCIMNGDGVFVGANEVTSVTNDLAPVFEVGQGDFNTIEVDFQVSSTFMPGDRYDFFVYPLGARTGAGWLKRNTRYFIRKMEITPADGPDQKTKNRLLPDKDYEVSVRLREFPEGAGEKVGIRLWAQDIPNIGSASSIWDNPQDPGKALNFSFNFFTQEWQLVDPYAYGDSTTEDNLLNNTRLYTVGDLQEEFFGENNRWRILTIPFNTKNDNIGTPDQWEDYSTRNYIQQMYRHGHPLHTINTVYHLELSKMSTVDDDTPSNIVVDKVSFKMKDYDELLSNYTYEGLYQLFRKFDTIATSGDSSRDASYASGSYLTSGGTRISYETEFGGDFSGIADATKTYTDTLDGVLYKLDDK